MLQLSFTYAPVFVFWKLTLKIRFWHFLIAIFGHLQKTCTTWMRTEKVLEKVFKHVSIFFFYSYLCTSFCIWKLTLKIRFCHILIIIFGHLKQERGQKRFYKSFSNMLQSVSFITYAPFVKYLVTKKKEDGHCLWILQC